MVSLRSVSGFSLSMSSSLMGKVYVLFCFSSFKTNSPFINLICGYFGLEVFSSSFFLDVNFYSWSFLYLLKNSSFLRWENCVNFRLVILPSMFSSMWWSSILSKMESCSRCVVMVCSCGCICRGCLAGCCCVCGVVVVGVGWWWVGWWWVGWWAVRACVMDSLASAIILESYYISLLCMIMIMEAWIMFLNWYA